MTREEFSKLERGDIVKHKGTGASFVVDSNYGSRVTAVTSADLTNPDEWERVPRPSYFRSKDGVNWEKADPSKVEDS